MPASEDKDTAKASAAKLLQRGTRSRKGTRREYVEVALTAEQIAYCKQIAESAGFASVPEGIRQIVAEHQAGEPEADRLKAEIKQDEAFRAEVAGEVFQTLLEGFLNSISKKAGKPEEGTGE